MSGIGRLASFRCFQEEENINDLITLKNFSFFSLIKNLDGISYKHDVTSFRQLKEGIYIPRNVCNTFIKKYQEFQGDFHDEIANLFNDTGKTFLKSVELRSSTITDQGLEILLKHKLSSLSLWYCSKLTAESYPRLASVGENLQSLEVGFGTNVPKLPADFFDGFPNLRKLSICRSSIHDDLYLSQLGKLTYLDLSSRDQYSLSGIKLEFLSRLPNLVTLILHNVWQLSEQFNGMCDMPNLLVLDISHNSFKHGTHSYENPDQTLENLMRKLPKLKELDISGTNLDGISVPVAGLQQRRENPLEFLGLFNREEWRMSFDDIPAKEIAGTFNEQQILSACRYNLNRPDMLREAFHKLYDLIHFEELTDVPNALNIALHIMDKHEDSLLLSLGGSFLSKLLTLPVQIELDLSKKCHIVQSFLRGMEIGMKKGFVMVEDFKVLEILKDYTMFQYERLIKVLLHQISIHTKSDYVLTQALGVLNGLTLSADYKAKLAVNDLEIIKLMLDMINERLTLSKFDDVMSMGLIILWNVTALSDMNCGKFVENRGVECVVRWLEAFSNDEKLLRQLMNLLLKASCSHILRNGFMKTEFIELVSGFIPSERFSLIYSATGILTHIAFDGPGAWNIVKPERQNVLNRIGESIDYWNLNNEQEIVCDNLDALLKLVQCYETPQCQLFAVWTLAYLSIRNPVEQHHLLKQKNGHQILAELIENPVPDGRIKNFAQIAIAGI